MDTALLIVINLCVNRSWIDSASLNRGSFLSDGRLDCCCCCWQEWSMVCISVHIMSCWRHENHTAEVVCILEVDCISKADKLTKEFLCLRSGSLLDGSVRIVGAAQMGLEECGHGGNSIIVLSIKEFAAGNKEDLMWNAFGNMTENDTVITVGKSGSRCRPSR